jgi:tRNA A37 threonylcarbamoyladenosine synthetase subunit TsaC/SUA5/YrdC
MSLQTRSWRDVLAAPPRRRLLLSDPQDAEAAAAALAGGMVIVHGFANVYAITARPQRETVRRVNLLKGRPADQVCSITTTPLRIPLVYDWSRLPAGFTKGQLLSLMDALLWLGPCGFRGPAAAEVPDHLSQMDGWVRITQVIVPGYGCPSNDFLGRALAASGQDMLCITSATRSGHLSGGEEEPAHHRADALRAGLGSHPRLLLLEHDDDEDACRAYPMHAPMPTTIVAFHRAYGPDPEGRRRLVVERQGSLHLDDLRRVARRHGLEVVLGPRATRRLRLCEDALTRS